MQHAPVAGGGAHVSLLQTVFAPFHTPWIAVHWARVLIVQTCAAVPGATEQQAPVTGGGAHVSLPQTELTPFH